MIVHPPSVPVPVPAPAPAQASASDRQSRRPASRLGLLLAVCLGSGFASLAYQVTWIRLFSAGLGHELPAVLGVTAAFLGGLALGAWRFDARTIALRGAGRTPRSPARRLLELEAWIGAWGLASMLLVPFANRLALDLLGPEPGPAWHWLVVFVIPALALAPATIAMGGTLPALEQLARPLVADGRPLGALYAANTAGAVVGALAGTFLLLPALGLIGTLAALALVNGLIVLALATTRFPESTRSDALPAGAPPRRTARAARIAKAAMAAKAAKAAEAETAGRDGRDGGAAQAADDTLPLTAAARRALLVGTGLLGLGFEFAGLRGLSQILENTAYTHASVLAVYLAGTALGAALFHRLLRRHNERRLLQVLLPGLSVGLTAGGWTLSLLGRHYPALREALGDHLAGVVAAESLAALAVFGPATLLMGATFTLLVQGARRGNASPSLHASSDDPGESPGIGTATAWNTAGCALAPGLVALAALPALGLRHTLSALALGYVALLFLARPTPRTAFLRAAPAVVIALLLPATLDPRHTTTGEEPGPKVIAAVEGALATATVVQTPDGHRALRVNQRLQMGGTASAVAQQRQAHLPLLLHPAPRRALFLGPGTGITLGAAAHHPGLQATGVELLPEVVALMPRFAPENGGPFPNSAGTLQVKTADARRFLRTDTNRYEVIVADLFHPGQDGAGFLYTRDHFEAARQRLSDGGLFCQWLPLHQLDPGTLRLIVRTFTAVFSNSRAVFLHFNVDIPVLGLIGAREEFEPDPALLDQRLANPALRPALRACGLDRPLAVLGCLTAGPDFLRRFGQPARPATDHRPSVLFAAPRFSIQRHADPRQTLEAWLDAVAPASNPAPDAAADAVTELLGTPLLRRDTAFAGHLREFLAARDLYLRGLIREARGDLAGAIEVYLASSGRSLYFIPAYARMITVIQLLAQSDRDRAFQLWQRLEQTRPDQPLGRQLLAPLFESPTPSSAPADAPKAPPP